MKFGIFYEHQLPRPWSDGAEQRLFNEALEQVEVADRLGIDFAWEVEHHFLEEYSHSSAPEVFLAACSQRTKNIRLGHGIRQVIPGYNHPGADGRGHRHAGPRLERPASSSAPANHPRNSNSVASKSPWTASAASSSSPSSTSATCSRWIPIPATRANTSRCPAETSCRSRSSGPIPPLWVACSQRETIRMAARLGIGALTFAFVDPAEATEWVDEYYSIIKSDQCVPIGHAVNANICMVSSFSCHHDRETAIQRGLEGFEFFGFALGSLYAFGEHKPGRTNLWEQFHQVRTKTAEEGGDRRAALRQPGRHRHARRPARAPAQVRGAGASTR